MTKSKVLWMILVASAVFSLHSLGADQVPVDQTSVDDLIDAGFKNVLATNRDKLTKQQEEEVKENIREEIKNGVDRTGKKEVFDDDLSQVLACQHNIGSDSSRRRHLKECGDCNHFTREALAGTGIRPISFRPPPPPPPPPPVLGDKCCYQTALGPGWCPLNLSGALPMNTNCTCNYGYGRVFIGSVCR